MTKGRVVLPSGLVAGIENSRSPFDFAQGRLSTSLRSGRDDNSYFDNGFCKGCECQNWHPYKKVTGSRDDKGKG
jgi:hypothetical protein